MFTLTTASKFDDLERLIDRFVNMGAGESRKIANGITQEIQANFTQQRSGNGAWSPLAPATILDRQRQGYAGRAPIRVRSGRGRAGYVDRGSPDHHERIWQSPLGLTIEAGSNDERVSLLHERGTRRMPARPATLFGEQSEQNLFRLIDYAIDGIERREWR